jgi:Proline racemase
MQPRVRIEFECALDHPSSHGSFGGTGLKPAECDPASTPSAPANWTSARALRLLRERAPGVAPPPRATARRRHHDQQGLLGLTFLGRIAGETEVAGLPAILPEVTGTAYITGTSEFFFDPDDPLREGFLL